MTMLELLVTAGIIAMLLGLGVGFLRRSDGMPETRSALAGALRQAALDARTRGLPTDVLLQLGRDGALAEVIARGLDPVVMVSFEPGQRFADGDLAPVLGGEDVEGRTGRGRTPRAGDASAALRLQLPPTTFDLREGFALRLDVLLRARSAGRLLRLARGLDLQLDEQGRPHARFEVQQSEGRGGAPVTLAGSAGLPVGRWCTVEVAADGRKAWCAVDGRVVAESPLQDALVRHKDDALEVLPGDEPLPAVVDELQLFSYLLSPPQRLPEGVVPAASVLIAFDARGEPMAPPELRFEVLSDHRTEVLRVGPGGVLQ